MRDALRDAAVDPAFAATVVSGQRQPPEPVEETIAPGLATEQGLTPVVEAGYFLGNLIGRGGEGEVREAVQRAFGRTVALKRVRGDATDAKRLRRFRAEARITALLEHPNIIPIYDLRVDASGVLDLVMKKVVGTTWRDLLRPTTPEHRERAEKLSFDDHLDILLKVCDAVGFAHSRGILHRDLKPENVMVGAHGEVLVMDWGCAASLGERSPHPDIPKVATLGGVSGTPAYMSPEQARNDVARQGEWSDVYLLGAALYEMIAGRPPRRGLTVRETVAAAARGEVAPPERADGKPVDEELAAVARAALAADPDHRTRSVDQLAAALRAWRRHVEAARLVHSAREHLRAATVSPDTGTGTGSFAANNAEEEFRRALSACEQALALRPDYHAGRVLLARVVQAETRHALDHQDFRTARNRAKAAGDAARAVSDQAGVAEAERLLTLARAGEATARAKERALRHLRKLATWGGSAVAAILLIGLVLLGVSSRNTSHALAEAQQNLAKFNAEQGHRLDREKLAVPALIAQARADSTQGNFIAALTRLDAALAFDPENPEARLMRARELIVLDRRPEARLMLEAQTADPAARQLLALLSRGDDARSRTELADCLLQQGATREAEALFALAGEQERGWRKLLKDAWPGFQDRWLEVDKQGCIIRVPRGNGLGITDLAPLRALPLRELILPEQTHLRDLAPLRGLPLARVDISDSLARDLAPLRDSPLKALAVARTQVVDLSPLAGLQLEEIDLAGCALEGIAALEGLPLRSLSLWNCSAVDDLVPVRHARLETLILGGQPGKAPRISSLRPIEGQPLATLDLRNNTVLRDFSGLERVRPGRLLLDGTHFSDLSLVWSLRLTQIGLAGTTITDLSPLARQPLRMLNYSPQTVAKGLDELRRKEGMERINDLPAADWWAIEAMLRQLVQRNSTKAWAGQALVENRKPVELTLNSAQLVDITPLAGLPLRRLVLVGNKIDNGEKLLGLPLVVVNLDQNPLRDLSWVNPATLVELRIAGSQVADLTPLTACTRLSRLTVVGCLATDLTAICDLPLEELVISAKQLKDVAARLRRLVSLVRIGTVVSDLKPAAEFWKLWDAGKVK